MLIYKNETKLILEFPSPDICARFEQWLRQTLVLFDADLHPSSEEEGKSPPPLLTLHKPIRKQEWELSRMEAEREKQRTDAVAKSRLPFQFRKGNYPWTTDHDPNAKSGSNPSKR